MVRSKIKEMDMAKMPALVMNVKFEFGPLEKWIKMGYEVRVVYDQIEGYRLEAARQNNGVRIAYWSDSSEWLDLAIESLARRMAKEVDGVVYYEFVQTPMEQK